MRLSNWSLCLQCSAISRWPQKIKTNKQKKRSEDSVGYHKARQGNLLSKILCNFLAGVVFLKGLRMLLMSGPEQTPHISGGFHRQVGFYLFTTNYLWRKGKLKEQFLKYPSQAPNPASQRLVIPKSQRKSLTLFCTMTQKGQDLWW